MGTREPNERATYPIALDDDDLEITEVSSTKEILIIEELGEQIDLSANFDWKKVEINPNMKSIWDTFNQLYFNDYQPFKEVTIRWNASLGEKSCEIRETEVVLHEDLKIAPRAEMIAVLLRAMLIKYLKEKFNFTENSANFKSNFTKMRKKLNTIWLINIKEDDLLENKREINRRQWYRCTGICQHHSPFNGIYRSESKPSGANQWWLAHHDNCGASLFRLYEAVSTTTNQRAFYANTKYMSVKIDVNKNKNLIKPKEVLDLTIEHDLQAAQLSPNVTISLDESDVASQCDDDTPMREFFQKFDESLGTDYDAYRVPCPFCKERIPRKLLSNHFDGCFGYQTKVNISRQSAIAAAGMASTSRAYESETMNRFVNGSYRRSSTPPNGTPPYRFYKRPRFT